VDQTPVVYTFGTNPFAGLRAEIKPEVFLTRRLALSLKAGYLWTPAIASDPSHPREQDLNKACWTYYGWNHLVSPDGSRWVFDLSGFYASLAISLFF
jgi:hypothetical protein